MSEQAQLSFDGDSFNQEQDGVRLTGQIARVYDVMKDGNWRSVSEIHDAIYKKFKKLDPENSIQAQLRNLRKPRFGAHEVLCEKREGSNNLSEYKLAISYFSEKATPDVIKKQPLIVYSGNSARLTIDWVEKPIWLQIDQELRKKGYDYRGYGLWKK